MYKVKEVGTKSPHGIYVYDPKEDCWVLVRSDGDPFIPSEDGVYVIYFDNTKCPACRRYDPAWFSYVRKWSKKDNRFHFVIVLCDWFARECKSEAAAKTFREYKVSASPTTLFLYVKNGQRVYDERYEGVLYEFELNMISEGFIERAEKSIRGEKVQPPIKTTTTATLQQLIEELLKLIIEKEKEERR